MRSTKRYVDMSREELLKVLYGKNQTIIGAKIVRDNLRKQIYEFRSRVMLITKRVRRIEDDLKYMLEHPYSKLTTKSMNNPPIAKLSKTYNNRKHIKGGFKDEMPVLQQGD